MSDVFDPVLAEVMRHELIAASEEMNITMKQTTRSIVAKEGGDFSAGLLDPPDCLWQIGKSRSLPVSLRRS